MVWYCIVAGCKSISIPKSDTLRGCVSFHRFPSVTKDPVRHAKWISWVKLYRKDFTKASPHTRICSKHFTEDSYENWSECNLKLQTDMSFKIRLAGDAIPSIYTPPAAQKKISSASVGKSASGVRRRNRRSKTIHKQYIREALAGVTKVNAADTEDASNHSTCSEDDNLNGIEIKREAPELTVSDVYTVDSQIKLEPEEIPEFDVCPRDIEMEVDEIEAKLAPNASGTTAWQELLIELVRETPCLYDKLHGCYEDNQGVTNDSWEDIAKSMAESGFSHIIPNAAAALEKWTDILDRFVRSIHRCQSQVYSDGNAEREPYNVYWHQLRWLLPFYSKDTTSSKASISGSSISSFSPETISSSLKTVSQRPSHEAMPIKVDTNETPANAVLAVGTQHTRATVDVQLSEVLSSLTRNLNDTSDDEHDVFGKLVARKMREIKDQAKVTDARLEILAVLKHTLFPPV